MRRFRRNAQRPRPDEPGESTRSAPERESSGAPNPPASSEPTESSASPEAPHDGDHNQGGTRPEGLDYQRDLGAEQDA